MASAAMKRPLLVVAGVGNGTGTGAATARLFAKSGYRVALIARNEHNLKATAEDIKAKGGEAAPFPVPSYKPQDLTNVFHQIKEFWPDSELRVAVWNAGQFVWKPFLQLTDDDVEQALDTNVRAAFAFSRGSLLAFQENELDHLGKKGTLIFTGATASLKGNKATSAFSAAKFGLRSLSQSLNKEFGPQNIHVAHTVMDGNILTNVTAALREDPAWEQNEDVRINPESIAKTYLFLANQDRSAWTWEIDLRPAHESW